MTISHVVRRLEVSWSKTIIITIIVIINVYYLLLSYM